MTIVACSRCGVNAYDNNTQFSLAKVKVEDASCSYFVEPNEYAVRCGFVRDPHVDSFSVTDNPCPNMKQAIVTNVNLKLGWQSI
jgi:hypothetical protein